MACFSLMVSHGTKVPYLAGGTEVPSKDGGTDVPSSKALSGAAHQSANRDVHMRHLLYFHWLALALAFLQVQGELRFMNIS